MMMSYDERKLASLLPIPANDANKYSRGKLIVFAGSNHYPGAAILAAWAGQRAGAGYTQVFTSPSVVPLVQIVHPSLVVRSDKGLLKSDFTKNHENRPCAYVVGPGFEGGKRSAYANTRLVLERAKASILVDGGALAALTSSENLPLCTARKEAGYSLVITPHWGEALQLAEVFSLASDDPAQLCYALSVAYDAITVLKGPTTYVSDGDKVFSMSQGSSALAKAGTGDVLSGVIGAFLAQGMHPFDACVLGVSIHGKAGCLAESDLTAISVTAEDVIEYIPIACQEFMRFRTE